MGNIKKGRLFMLIGAILVATSLIYAVYNYTPLFRNNLKNEIYSEFTCTCCEGSILETSDSCYMAGGMRDYINKLVIRNNDKDELMLEAVKKFGIPSLINKSLQGRYGLMLLNNTPDDAPNMSISPQEVDLGIVSNSKGIIIQDFNIKNEGKADLIITDLKTTCSCLTASFIKNGEETVRVGRFSHSQGWTFVLKPGEEALLRGYYDPRVTNWQLGHVERLILITSNDPLYFEGIVKIIAELVP